MMADLFAPPSKQASVNLFARPTEAELAPPPQDQSTGFTKAIANTLGALYKASQVIYPKGEMDFGGNKVAEDAFNAGTGAIGAIEEAGANMAESGISFLLKKADMSAQAEHLRDYGQTTLSLDELRTFRKMQALDQYLYDNIESKYGKPYLPGSESKTKYMEFSVPAKNLPESHWKGNNTTLEEAAAEYGYGVDPDFPLSDFEPTIKLRISDHSKTSGLHESPDINIVMAPHGIDEKSSYGLDLAEVLGLKLK